MTPLYFELHRLMCAPFEWGRSDCMTALADWILRVRGVDPLATVRLTYQSASEAERLYGWLSRPVQSVDHYFVPCGLGMTAAPVRGDVGIVQVRGGGHAVGGICLGENWAFRSEDRGVVTVKPKFVSVLGAWEVGYVDP
ncbi:hypothetical protein AQS8620_01294 [Aquimixticola soesokkakensis]|uniref:DUF6950 domain-containing protein n=1 Tax=Aquimixticola soesokkakensis TaxID=1519096 RepID=A0A1Y5SFH6_9RHOB|nr:hypothetical protein [Aquimixticola soesokkakensis]SLN36475.1 hypothetical protein AQS8620_01294 [Aquimixticola soesokkakensis]